MKVVRVQNGTVKIEVKSRRAKAEDSVRKVAAVSVSYLSRAVGPPPLPEVVEQRWQSCRGCEAFREVEGGRHICEACGCGMRKILEDAISGFPYLECPKSMPGFNPPKLLKKAPNQLF